MVDMTRELSRAPAREPLVSLAAVVRDFKWRYPRARRDMVVEFTRTAPNLGAAIERAVASKGADGKHHNHQSKVKRTQYAPFTRVLMQRRVEMSMLSSFGELMSLVDSCARQVGGWGPVGVYDVSTRLAAYLELEVDAVYLHAGVEAGAVALFGAPWVKWHSTGMGVFRRIERAHLVGYALDVLDMDSVEDLLCTYRQLFLDERFAELGLAWADRPVKVVGDVGAGGARKVRRKKTRTPKRQ